MGRKLRGKDGLNSCVKNSKENWVDKFVGNWVKKVVKNVCGKTGFTNCVIKMGGKVVCKNCVKNLCEKIRWKIV